MTMEHLRPLLDSPKDLKLFFKMAEILARAEVSDAVIPTIRMGRMTALHKPSGGVRGIVAGDVIRRLVARTMAQQVVNGRRGTFGWMLCSKFVCNSGIIVFE